MWIGRSPCQPSSKRLGYGGVVRISCDFFAARQDVLNIFGADPAFKHAFHGKSSVPYRHVAASLRFAFTFSFGLCASNIAHAPVLCGILKCRLNVSSPQVRIDFDLHIAPLSVLSWEL